MVSDKRARQVARAKAERQAARRATQKRQNRARALWAAGIVFGLVVVGGIVFAAWPESTPTTTPASDATVTNGSPSPAPIATPQNVNCTEATPSKQSKSFAKPKDEGLKPGATMTLGTNCGSIVVDLDVAQAPKTSNAIAFLADQGWYNNNSCHRLTVEGIFVVQCGSPSLDGQGGPGFKLPEENLPKAGANGVANYAAGTVAMTNAGKGTGGSQFFLAYQDSPLQPDYTIVGQVTSGLDVVQYVASQGVSPASTSGPSDGPPNQPLIIKTAIVRNG
ncbi:MAG: peptidylprolyl isomerase [Candidatus Nanopelagicales bacterium]